MLAFAACADAPRYTGTDFASDPPPPGPMGGNVIVCNAGDDTLSVVDPAGRRKLWQIPIGFIPVEIEGPHDVGADPAGRFYYVTLSESVANSGGGPHGAHGTGTIPGYVMKFDANDGTLLAFAQLDPNPAELAVSPDGKTLFVTHFDLVRWMAGANSGDIRNADAHLAVLDADTMDVRQLVPLCPAPHGIEITDDGATIYTTCGPDEIAVVDVATLAVRRVPLTPTSVEGSSCAECPYRLSLAPDGTVWVASLGINGGGQGLGTVRVYDPALQNFDPARALNFCGRATAVGFAGTATSYQAFAVEQGPCGDWVRKYASGAAGQAPPAITQLQTTGCTLPNDLDVDDTTGYLTCEGDHIGPGAFGIFDATAMTMTTTIPTGVLPLEMSAIPRKP